MRKKPEWSSPKQENVKMEKTAPNRIIPQPNANIK